MAGASGGRASAASPVVNCIRTLSIAPLPVDGERVAQQAAVMLARRPRASGWPAGCRFAFDVVNAVVGRANLTIDHKGEGRRSASIAGHTDRGPHHFAPHPDTLLFFIVTSRPRFTKKVGANVLSLRQVFSIVKWFTGSVGVVLLVSLQMPY